MKKKQYDVKDIGNLDRIIHEPARLMIVSVLSVITSADYTFIMSQTGLSWGNLSSHVSKLENAKYVEVQKTFVDRKPRTTLTLTTTGKTAFEEYVRTIKAVFLGQDMK